MRFTSTIFAAVALATSVFAQTDGFAPITAPTRDQDLQAGSTFTIQWQTGTTPRSEAFTISLLQGATPGTLELGAVIAAGVMNTGTFSWTVPSNLKFATYGIKISLDSNPSTFQYSNPFHIVGGSSSSSSSSSATISISSSGSSSSTSASTTKSSMSSTMATSTVTGSTTSIPSPSTTSSAVIIGVNANGTTTAVTTAPVTSAMSPPIIGGGNSTIATATMKPTTTLKPTTSIAGSGSGSATTSPTTVPSNGAMAKAATGGFAMLGGMVLALAL